MRARDDRPQLPSGAPPGEEVPPPALRSRSPSRPLSEPPRNVSKKVATSHPWRDRPFAVIDLGSNSARLVIYRSAPVGPPWSIHESKEYPRLVEGILEDGSIAPRAVRRGIETLARFRKIIDSFGVLDIHAVATSAVRDAPNGPGFIEMIRRRFGIPLRVLSSEDEARYAFLGVASSLPLQKDLIIDLGGGSIQAIQVRDEKLVKSLSLPLGALRLHRRFIDHDPPKPKELHSLEDFVDEELRELDLLRAGKDERIVGVGGTIRSLAHAMQSVREYPLARVHGYVLRTRDLERLYDILSESSTPVRRDIPGLSANRADIIVAGLAVVLGVLHRRRASSLTVSGCGIREGLAQEILDRDLPSSVEVMGQASALASLWASGSDGAHARRVRELALHLFDITRAVHQFGDEERLVLEISALMHDVGSTLSYPSHAAHSAYILRSRPIYGLSHRGFLLASLVVSMHEGSDVPSDTLRRYPLVLEEDDMEVARVLGSILAFSESMGDVRPKPRIVRKGNRLVVSCSRTAAIDPRLFERASRWLRRHLKLKVHVEQ